MSVSLRVVSIDDYGALFEHMRNPESVWMAAFTPEDPNDRFAFDTWMAALISSPEITIRAVIYKDRLAGRIACFVADGATEITHWIGRTSWEMGIQAELSLSTWRRWWSGAPARAACDNVRSVSALKKADFHAIGTEVSFAAATGLAIRETIKELGAETWSVSLSHRR